MASETVVIGLNWVGDNVLALPTYRALQHRFRNDGGIAVAVPENVGALMASTGISKQVITWSRSTKERVAVLRERRFRRAIILPNSFRSALVPLLAGIPERWGYGTDWRRLLLTNSVRPAREPGHQLDDYGALLAGLNAPHVVNEIPKLAIARPIREEALRRLQVAGVTSDRPLIGIHPGGLFGRAKHWGDERFIQLVERLRASGAQVVFLTSPGERVQAETMAAACNGVPVTGHDGDVLHLAAAISHCSAIVTNDSGPLHIATALAVPSVSIFGPTDPGRTVVAGASRVVRNELDCQPCYRRECPLRHHRCMADIAVDTVYDAAVGLLSEIDTQVAFGSHHPGGRNGAIVNYHIE